MRLLAATATCVLIAMAGASPGPAENPAPGAEPEPSIVKGGDLDLLQEVRRIASRLEVLRGSRFPAPPVALRAPQDARHAVASNRVAASIAASRLEARGRAWADLGLGDPTAPRELYGHLASDLDGIVFDPVGPRLLVDPDLLSPRDFEPAQAGDAATEVLLATGVRLDEPLVVHALAHALERERAGADWLEETTDATLAASAWAEGEANLLAVVHLFDGMGLQREALTRGLDPGDVLEGRLLPAALRSTSGVEQAFLDFVYEEGFAQAVNRFLQGGWRALEGASRARKSTSDLLHGTRAPSKPFGIALPVLALPEGYLHKDRDVLGEEGVIALVSLLTGKDNLGLMAGDGWRGDALDRWEGPGDPAAGLTRWLTRWTTPEEASDFEYGFVRTLEARFPSLTPTVVGPGRRSLVSSDRVFRLERKGDEVLIRVAPLDIDRRLEGPRLSRPLKPTKKIKN